MKSEVEIETGRPEEISEIIGLSLEGNHKVSYSLEAKQDKIVIKTETDGLGPLRGCTDTVFRLASLAEKLY